MSSAKMTICLTQKTFDDAQGCKLFLNFKEKVLEDVNFAEQLEKFLQAFKKGRKNLNNELFKAIVEHLKVQLVAKGYAIPSNAFHYLKDVPNVDTIAFEKIRQQNDLSGNIKRHFEKKCAVALRDKEIPPFVCSIIRISEEEEEGLASVYDVSMTESVPESQLDESMVSTSTLPDQCACGPQIADLQRQIAVLELENDKLKKLYENQRKVNLRDRTSLDNLSSNQPIRKRSFEGQQISNSANVALAELTNMKNKIQQFAGRGRRHELLPRTIRFIMELAIRARSSVRSIETCFDALTKSIDIFQDFNFPRMSSVFKVLGMLEPINDYMAIQYLASSSKLQVCFDSSTKQSKSILGVLLINDMGSKYFFDSIWAIEGTSEAHSDLIINMFQRLSQRAEDQEYIKLTAAEWFQKQLSKISFVMSDSCNQALLAKKLLIDKVKEKSNNPDQLIMTGDCAMHIVMNCEKQCAARLGPHAAQALKVVQEKLASTQLMSNQSLCNAWMDYLAMDDLENNCKYTPAHGSRFAFISRNAVKITSHLEALKDFSSQNQALTSFHALLISHSFEIREELLAISLMWYYLILPLWVDVAKAKMPESIQLLKTFLSVLSLVEHEDPFEVLTNERKNVLLRADKNNGNKQYY